MTKENTIIDMYNYKKETEKKERSKMDAFKAKLDLTTKIFVGGAKEQLKSEATWSSAAVIGLTQGLKYNGDIKRGLKGGAATVGVYLIANGIANVVRNVDTIKDC